jgi:NADPH-dependent 2,4-dienoyl-CoA reductase/sulfur reductase-like enzyme
MLGAERAAEPPGRVVVVGASVCGVRTAQALRREGFAGQIVLVGEEQEPPYDKPPLSKQYLTGSYSETKLRLLTFDAASSLGVEMRLGTAATGLDVAGHRLHLSDTSSLDYGACVIATGASARPSPWTARTGVHLLRTRADSDRLRSSLRPGRSVVVVGGGFIGAEVAAGATALGCLVSVVDPLPSPASRVVGDDVGALLGTVHARHGVATRFGVGVASLEGAEGQIDVGLTDGSTLRADLAVVGIGAIPNDAWLASSGLPIDDGLLCDEFCRAVDAHRVFCAGDVARWLHVGYGDTTRVEHWTNAVEQAACVAHNIAHPENLRPHRPVEYVWSDQYDWKIQVVGRPDRGEAHHLVGDPDQTPPRWAALFAGEGGRLVGAVTVNWPRASVDCRRLTASGAGIAAAMASVSQLAAPARH